MQKKKILVTGALGQLGNEFRDIAGRSDEHDFVFTDLPECDLTDEAAVYALAETTRPDIIIHCAAYTAVDKAETDPDAAFRMNAEAVKHMALAANRVQAFMIYISTDYVFDGTATIPYTEDTEVNPSSVYGKSKLQGERHILRHLHQGMIIRTSWLYSAGGHNFVRTMMRLGEERNEVEVVNDQYGCPTWANDLAHAIMEILPCCPDSRQVEVFHYCNAGLATWFTFAQAVFEFSGISCELKPVSTPDFPAAARRPQYSVLDTAKIRERFGLIIPPWRGSLQKCVQLLLK